MSKQHKQIRLDALLKSKMFSLGSDGIYSCELSTIGAEQFAEIELRQQVASKQCGDYLTTIARHHSIPVMDYEVDRFLSLLPMDALILDIGGCWGWHWRRLTGTRPDVGVLIIDFVKENLIHAKNMLGPLIDSQIALMHADATALPFPDSGAIFQLDDQKTSVFAGFDGIWTVQTFQHIPNFAKGCKEAYRVLKPGGCFLNYSLHSTPLNRMIYRLLGKSFHAEGMMKGQYHLTRANNKQRQIVADIFGGGGGTNDTRNVSSIRISG